MNVLARLEFELTHYDVADQSISHNATGTLTILEIAEKMLQVVLNQLMLYIDLRPRQTCHSKDGGSAYSIRVGEIGWQYGTGFKSHGTVTVWCTGREWPVNCMTVISAWWRFKHAIPKMAEVHIPMASYGEILSGRELLYNWVHMKFNLFGEKMR